MKNNCLFIMMLALCCVLLVSCKDEFGLEEKPIALEENILRDLPSTTSLINKYISQKSTQTRTMTSSYTIEPYVLDGDTTLYFVNYAEGGWGIFSAKLQAPMLLFSSTTGSISVDNMSTIPTTCLDFINSVAESIMISEKSNDAYIDESWVNVILSSNSIIIPPLPPSDTIHSTTPDVIIMDSLYYASMLGEGHWEIDTVTNIIDQNRITHLIPVHWGQMEPYNTYIPYDLSSGDSLHSAVGCVALSTAECLLYLHQKDGIVPSAYTQATYVPARNRYVFSNLSTTIWDHLMPFANGDLPMDSIALVLGYISNNLSTGFSRKATSSSIGRIPGYLLADCGINTTFRTYDIEEIIRSITNLYPVITSASGSCDGEPANHCFIIDGYFNRRTELNEYIKWVGTDANGNSTNQYDGNGRPVSYRYSYYKIIRYTNEPYITMNWGWEGGHDEMWFNASDTWTLRPGNYYNLKKNIIILN